MSGQFASWVDVLQAQASIRPDKVAFTFLADGEHTTVPLTFRQLDQRARGIAAELAIHAAPGARVLLLYPPGLEFIAGFFGCLYAGMVAVPAIPPLTAKAMERIDVLVRDADASAVLTTAAVRSRLPSRSERGSPFYALPCNPIPLAANPCCNRNIVTAVQTSGRQCDDVISSGSLLVLP
jgi:acyl-CoA synthetase (AMP-forming)/AMP-acid ligase II